MNRRAFFLGAGAAVLTPTLAPPGWVRRAYSFLWSRPNPGLIYIDTETLVGSITEQQWMAMFILQYVERARVMKRFQGEG